VHYTVELIGVDDLRVDGDNRGLFTIKLVGFSESLPGLGLSTARRSHGEHTMTNSQKLTKLNDLEDISIIGENLKFLSSLVNDSFEFHVSLTDRVNSREKIT
jgi:hypothetical protein